MQRESTIIFILTVLIGAGIVAGANYWYTHRNADQTLVPQQAEKLSFQPGSTDTPKRTPPRTDTPIECPLPDGTTFWTNTTRCEDADLENRISHSEPVETYRLERAKQKFQNQNRGKTQQREKTRKPKLLGPGRSPPPDTPADCKFAIGMALEKERMLSAADDPGKSVWRDSYCRWIKDARGDSCEISSEYFYYSHLCPTFGP